MRNWWIDDEAAENRDLAKAELRDEIEAELKGLGCCFFTREVQITQDDWNQIQQDSTTIEAAYQEAFDTIDTLYNKFNRN